MRILFTVVFSFFIICFGKAQGLSIAAGVGGGSSYIIEDWEAAYFSYDPTLSASFNMAYDFQQSDISPRIDLLYNQTKYEQKWGAGSSQSLEGSVSTYSLIVGMESVKDTGRVNIGYRLGTGLTYEHFSDPVFWWENHESTYYPSALLGAIIEFKLSKKAGIRFEPMLFWTDMINTFKTAEWRTGGEDLSAVYTLNFRYQF